MSEIQRQRPILKRTWARHMEKCSFGIIPPCMPHDEPDELRESSWVLRIPNNEPYGLRESSWDGKAFLNYKNAYVWNYEKDDFDIIPRNLYKPEDYIEDKRLLNGEYNLEILSDLDSCKKDTSLFSFNDHLLDKKVEAYKIIYEDHLECCDNCKHSQLSYKNVLMELIDN